MPDSLSGAIIAAGRGERLRSASNALPKPLVEINGEPLLLRQVRLMLQAGISPVHSIVNTETADLLKERHLPVPDAVQLMVADTASSMESLLLLGERIEAPQFVLATVDAIIGADEFKRFLDYSRRVIGQQSLDGVLAVVRWRGDHRPLFVGVEQGLIARMGDQVEETVTAGIYFLSARIFSYAQEARLLKLDALRKFLGLLLERGLRLGAYQLKIAIDVDEGTDLEVARSMFASESSSRKSG